MLVNFLLINRSLNSLSITFTFTNRRSFTLRSNRGIFSFDRFNARTCDSIHLPSLCAIQAKEIQRKQSAEEWRTDISGIVAPADSPKALMLPVGEDRSATPDDEEKRRASERASACTHVRGREVGNRTRRRAREGRVECSGVGGVLVGHGRTVGHRKAERNNYYLRPIGARQD